MTVVPVTSADLEGAEVSWFAALCSDDYQFLGVPDGALRSSWEHCSDIVQKAEQLGFRNILCPSSYQVGQDTLSFVAGCAPITSKINMLAAIRCGEMQPIMLARTVATLDHMLKGRLTLNVISSDFPAKSPTAPFAIAAVMKSYRSCARPGRAIRSTTRERSTSSRAFRPIRPSPTSRMAAPSSISAATPPMRWSFVAPNATSI